MNRDHVLIIGPDENTVEIEHVFKSNSFVIEVADSIQQSLQLCSERVFKIIFIDNQFLNDNNINYIQKLARYCTHIVIQINTRNHISENTEILKQGIGYFLISPIETVELDVLLSILKNTDNDSGHFLKDISIAQNNKKQSDYSSYNRDIDYFNTLMNTIPDSIYFKDEKCRFVKINKSQCNTLGITHTVDALGKTDFDFFTAEKAREAFADEQEILKSGKPLIAKVEQDIRPDGWTRWVTSTKVPIYKDDKIIGLFGVTRDISSIKKVQEELYKSEEKYRTLFEGSIDAIFMTDADGVLIDINKSGYTMLGYSSKEPLLNTDFFSKFCIQNENCNSNDFYDIIETDGYIKDYEIGLYDSNKNKIPVTITASAIKENGRSKYIIYFLHNLTRHYIQEKQLNEKNKELSLANEILKSTQASLIHQEKLASIGQLAAGIAHELNNPLAFTRSNFNTLNNYTKTLFEYITYWEQLMKDFIGDDKQALINTMGKISQFKKGKNLDFILEDIKDIFDESNEGFKRIDAIVQSLRDFSRVDNEHKREMFNLNKAITDTLTVAKNEIKYCANIVLNLGDIPLVSCIGSDINQVLLNIIINATQAIKSIHKEELGVITIETFCNEKFVFCEISDSGPGIPQANLSKIFDPFFTTKEIGKGTGLGLNISYDIIVNKHKGQLLVESQNGQGAKFIIKLPL